MKKNCVYAIILVIAFISFATVHPTIIERDNRLFVDGETGEDVSDHVIGLELCRLEPQGSIPPATVIANVTSMTDIECLIDEYVNELGEWYHYDPSVFLIVSMSSPYYTRTFLSSSELPFLFYES